jgi:hypothetical protein
MLVGAADAGAEQPVMSGVVTDNSAGHGASQAVRGIRMGNGKARQRERYGNQHDLFHDTLRFRAQRSARRGNGASEGEVHPPRIAYQAIMPFSLATAAPGAVNTGQRTAGFTAAAAREVEKCASITAS